MPRTNRETATISIRVPAQVKAWVDKHGGGDFVKALLISQWFEWSKKTQEVPHSSNGKPIDFQI